MMLGFLLGFTAGTFVFALLSWQSTKVIRRVTDSMKEQINAFDAVCPSKAGVNQG